MPLGSAAGAAGALTLLAAEFRQLHGADAGQRNKLVEIVQATEFAQNGDRRL